MTILPVAPGVRVAGAKVTAVIWVPIIPEATDELAISLTAFPEAPALEGPTVTPTVGTWAIPIVPPVNVSVVEPAVRPPVPKTTVTVVETPAFNTGVIAV